MALISSAIAGTAGVAALLGAGGIAAGVAANNKKKKPTTPDMPDIPTPESAEDKAKADMLKRRKTIARSGGKTILASQYGGNTDTTTKTLLGE